MMTKREIPLKVPPDLKIGGAKVNSMTLTIMPADERFAEKEVARQQDYDDIQSGRCTPKEVNDRNAIKWGKDIKVTMKCSGDFGWD